MKYLLIILFSLFFYNASGKEVIMTCKLGDKKVSLKYLDPLVGFKKILIRRKGGKWEDWGSNDDDYYEMSDLNINDMGATLLTKLTASFIDPPQEAGLKKNQNISYYKEYQVDFQFYERVVYTHATHLNGKTIKKGLRGYDPKKRWKDEWICKPYGKVAN